MVIVEPSRVNGMSEKNCRRVVSALFSIFIASSTTTCIASEIITQPPPTGDLNVGANQTVAIDFGQLGPQGLQLTGDLTNSGIVFAFSSNPNVSVANFSGANITNHSGGLITSVMPAAGLSGLNINPAYLTNSIEHTNLHHVALPDFQDFHLVAILKPVELLSMYRTTVSKFIYSVLIVDLVVF